MLSYLREHGPAIIVQLTKTQGRFWCQMACLLHISSTLAPHAPGPSSTTSKPPSPTTIALALPQQPHHRAHARDHAATVAPHLLRRPMMCFSIYTQHLHPALGSCPPSLSTTSPSTTTASRSIQNRLSRRLVGGGLENVMLWTGWHSDACLENLEKL